MCSQPCCSLQRVGSFGSCHLSGPDRALTWYKQAVVATVVTFLKHRRDDGTFPGARALPRNRAQRKGRSPWHIYQCLDLLANFSTLSHCSSSCLPYSPKEKNLPPFFKILKLRWTFWNICQCLLVQDRWVKIISTFSWLPLTGCHQRVGSHILQQDKK